MRGVPSGRGRIALTIVKLLDRKWVERLEMPDVTPHKQLDRYLKSAPFNRFRSIQRLSADRSGRVSVEHVRHQLYVGRDKRTRASALIKVLTKPGLVYEQNLTSEIATLSTINRKLPDSRYFPLLWDHGCLPDGRVFLIMALFHEWPLATAVGAERMPDRLVAHIRTSLEVGRAIADLHRIRDLPRRSQPNEHSVPRRTDKTCDPSCRLRVGVRNRTPLQRRRIQPRDNARVLRA